jgi:RecA-family ATPase
MTTQTNIDPGIGLENNVAVSSNPIEVNATQQLNTSSQLSNLPPKPPIIDQELIAVNDGQNPFDPNKELFTLEEILRYNFSEVPFLVKGLIPANCISLIVGESDLGKSTLHTQLALSIVSGCKTFLGREINTKYKRALIVSTEEGIQGIGERIEKQFATFQPDYEATKRLTILTTSSKIEEKIKRELRKNPVDLVVIDAFSDVFQKDMNRSNEVRTFFNRYAEIIREFNCAIVFITHIGKSKDGNPLHKNQVLGSVGIVDKARQVLMMSREKTASSNRQLTITKGNYVSEEEKKKALVLKFFSETRTFENLEERDVSNSTISPFEVIKSELEKEILRLRDQGLSYEDIGRRVHRHKSTISRIIQKYQYNIKQPVDADEIEYLL